MEAPVTGFSSDSSRCIKEIVDQFRHQLGNAVADKFGFLRPSRGGSDGPFSLTMWNRWTVRCWPFAGPRILPKEDILATAIGNQQPVTPCVQSWSELT